MKEREEERADARRAVVDAKKARQLAAARRTRWAALPLLSGGDCDAAHRARRGRREDEHGGQAGLAQASLSPTRRGTTRLAVSTIGRPAIGAASPDASVRDDSRPVGAEMSVLGTARDTRDPEFVRWLRTKGPMWGRLDLHDGGALRPTFLRFSAAERWAIPQSCLGRLVRRLPPGKQWFRRRQGRGKKTALGFSADAWRGLGEKAEEGSPRPFSSPDASPRPVPSPEKSGFFGMSIAPHEGGLRLGGAVSAAGGRASLGAGSTRRGGMSTRMSLRALGRTMRDRDECMVQRGAGGVPVSRTEWRAERPATPPNRGRGRWWRQDGSTPVKGVDDTILRRGSARWSLVWVPAGDTEEAPEAARIHAEKGLSEELGLRGLRLVDLSSNRLTCIPECCNAARLMLESFLLHHNAISRLADLVRLAALAHTLRALTLHGDPTRCAPQRWGSRGNPVEAPEGAGCDEAAEQRGDYSVGSTTTVWNDDKKSAGPILVRLDHSPIIDQERAVPPGRMGEERALIQCGVDK
eukprot:gene50144-65705_t